MSRPGEPTKSEMPLMVSLPSPTTVPSGTEIVTPAAPAKDTCAALVPMIVSLPGPGRRR